MSIIKYILITAVVLILLFFATRVVSVLVPFLIGFLLARTAHALAAPIVRFRSKRPGFNYRKKRSIELVMYGILVALVIIVAVIGIFNLIVQGSKAITSISNFVIILSDPVRRDNFIWQFAESNNGILKDSLVEEIIDYLAGSQTDFIRKIPEFIGAAVSSVWNIIGNIPYGIFVVISVFMSGYYFLSDGPNVLKAYMKSVPNQSFRRTSLELVNNLSGTLFRALGGYTLLLLVTMGEAWVTFYLADVDYAIVLALITAVLDFLPVLGISATMVPVIIYCVFHGNIKGAIIIIIAMTVMTIIRRYLEPAIVGKALHLHPLLMLISMALGVYIWGAIGFLLGPVVFIIILDVFKVFGFGKTFKAFLSRILAKIMKPDPEARPKEKEAVSED